MSFDLSSGKLKILFLNKDIQAKLVLVFYANLYANEKCSHTNGKFVFKLFYFCRFTCIPNTCDNRL